MKDDAGDEKNIGKILSAWCALYSLLCVLVGLLTAKSGTTRAKRFLATPNLRRFVAVRDTDFGL
jgi:hypothetical protein